MGFSLCYCRISVNVKRPEATAVVVWSYKNKTITSVLVLQTYLYTHSCCLAMHEWGFLFSRCSYLVWEQTYTHIMS